MLTARLNAFTPHPAQMRTLYDSDNLAALALQIYERGLNEWQPLVASKRADSTDDNFNYYLVSGHRRYMARLFAFALRDWAVGREDEEVSLEVAINLVHSFIEASTSLPEAITALLEKYGTEEVPFALFEGDAKDEILALQAANYGGELPDMLGIAHSFQQAAEAGAAVKEIARNSGQSEQYVRNHLALSNIPSALAARIAAGDLPLSVARTVADLPDLKRAGLSIFILANLSANSGKLTAKEIKQCATILKQWNGLQRPLVVRRRVALATAVLEGEVTVEDVNGRLAANPTEALEMAYDGLIPVLISPQLPNKWHKTSNLQSPISVLVDARMAKRNIDTQRQDAPLVVALGPGFTAGGDCDAVVETMRGHRLGRVVWQGAALPNTGSPGIVAGKGAERVLRAPTAGMAVWRRQIGDLVKEGDVMGAVAGEPVYAPFDGVVRGLIGEETAVFAQLKIGDVDPRADVDACFTISDKALSIGGGVLEAILTWLNNAS